MATSTSSAGADFARVTTDLLSSSEDVRISALSDYLRRGQNAALSIVVVGETGQGKSSLINGLLGEEIAKESSDLDSATDTVDSYKYEQNGVNVMLWDTPGFGVNEEEEEGEVMTKIRESCPSIDILLYCIRMDTKRWPTRSDVSTIRRYTEAYGSGIWQRSIFVMTFANTVPRYCPHEQDITQYFNDQASQWENQVRQTLIRYAMIEYPEARRVGVVPVGDPRPSKTKKIHWSLPGREDWFALFWIQCTRQMRQRAVQSLLLLNRHRFQVDSSAAQGANVSAQNSGSAREDKVDSDLSTSEDSASSESGGGEEQVYSRGLPVLQIFQNIYQSRSDS